MRGKTDGNSGAADLDAMAVQKALIAAEARCTLQGQRMNDASRRVLNALLTARTPLKAYDLTHALATGGRSAAPPTIYRALRFLVEAGLAHRISYLNAHVACRFPNEPHLAGFTICDRCGAADEFMLEEAPSQVGGLAGGRLILEVIRTCAACVEGAAQ